MTLHRRLAPDEEALWAMVVRSVKPLHPVAQPPIRALAERAQPVSAAVSAAAPRRADAGPRTAPLPGFDGARTRPPAFDGARTRPPALDGARTRPLAAAPPTETLDGAWDRRIISGRLHPDRTIDLHGLSLEAARHRLYDQVAAADARGDRIVLVITGKGQMPGPAPADLMPGLGRPHGGTTRGAIRVSLPRWVGEAGLSGRIAAVRQAHPRHGGAGAVYLILKRRRS